MSDSQALTEFDMFTVQGQTGLSESETVTSYTVSAAAAGLSHVCDQDILQESVMEVYLVGFEGNESVKDQN